MARGPTCPECGWLYNEKMIAPDHGVGTFHPGQDPAVPFKYAQLLTVCPGCRGEFQWKDGGFHLLDPSEVDDETRLKLDAVRRVLNNFQGNIDRLKHARN